MLKGCIYCESTEFDVEHWLPRCFGAFAGDMGLQSRICRQCNRELGRLDEEIIRTGPEGLVRTLLGIKGRHGSKGVNPAYYRAASSQPVRLTAVLSDGPMFLEPFSRDGVPAAKPARQITVEDQMGSLQRLVINVAWSADRLREVLATRRLEGSTLREVHCDPQDLEPARALLAEVFPNFEAQHFARDGAVSQKTFRGEFEVGKEYFRGIVKIAFHYAIKFLPGVNGNEHAFEVVRQFIKNGIGNSSHFVADISGCYADRPNPDFMGHLFTVRSFPGGVGVHAKFFAAPDHESITWGVLLTSTPMSDATISRAHAAVYLEEQPDGTDGALFEFATSEGGADASFRCPNV